MTYPIVRLSFKRLNLQFNEVIAFFTAPNETHLLPNLRFLKFSTRSGDTHFTPVSLIDNMLSRIVSPMLEEVQIDVSVRGPFKVYPTVIELSAPQRGGPRSMHGLPVPCIKISARPRFTSILTRMWDHMA